MTHTRRLLRETKRLGVYSRYRDLGVYFSALFRDVHLPGASLLDVGGGAGVAALYAASRGAKHVVCIEPEMDGSSGLAQQRFKVLAERAGITNATFVATSLGGYSSAEPFDIVLLHNTINHLDEAACSKLAEDPDARRSYQHHLRPLRQLTSVDGSLIVADASPHNFFAVRGRRNPLAPSIEWHKHQPPEIWIQLLTSLGFAEPVTRWTPLDVLSVLGLCLANRRAAYYHRSHFVVTMRRTSSPEDAGPTVLSTPK